MQWGTFRNNSEIMYFSSQSYPAPRRVKLLLACGLLISNVVFFALPGSAHSSAPSVADPPPSAEGMGGINAFWFGLIAIGCVGITGGVLLARKLRTQRAAGPAQPLRPGLTNNGAGKSADGSKPFRLAPKPRSRPKPLSVGRGNANNPKRRRMFNYAKFYTEMVMQGPTPVVGENYSYNGYEFDQARPNNNASGHNNNNGVANGNSNGNGHAAPAEKSAAKPGVAAEAHSELISSQKALIEEQKRLIEEQARLIEEKSRVIEEKNQLLNRQSEMIDNSLL
jgi:hypothetical protein